MGENLPFVTINNLACAVWARCSGWLVGVSRRTLGRLYILLLAVTPPAKEAEVEGGCTLLSLLGERCI